MINRRMTLAGTGAMLVAGPALGQHTHRHLYDPLLAQAPSRLLRNYQMPGVPLVDQLGHPVSLAAELEEPGPVLMTFIFTTCPGICPILSAVVADTAETLGADASQVRFWSITIDPDHDGPAQLQAYAALFDTGPRWRLHTGSPEAIAAVRRAFQADSDIKMAHRALYFLRVEDSTWIRFEGDVTAQALGNAARQVLARLG